MTNDTKQIDNDHAILTAMERYGGGFASALARAACHADSDNFQRLKGLPLLKPTKNVKAEMMLLPKRERERLHYLSPGPNRWKLRSKTFQGIANAMAAQWGNLEAPHE